jgi:hypothetical protein
VPRHSGIVKPDRPHIFHQVVIPMP